MTTLFVPTKTHITFEVPSARPSRRGDNAQTPHSLKDAKHENHEHHDHHENNPEINAKHREQRRVLFGAVVTFVIYLVVVSGFMCILDTSWTFGDAFYFLSTKRV
jgi:hypothetical protein